MSGTIDENKLVRLGDLEEVIDTTKSSLENKIDSLSSDIAIIIDGNKTTHTGGAAIGEFVLVRNSTISGITDGLYKATQAIPANTAITSAYLSAVDGGGLNALNDQIANIDKNEVVQLTAQVNTSTFDVNVCRYGNVIAGSVGIVTTETCNDLSTLISGFPTPLRNPQLPVWAYGNASFNRRVCIIANGQMQPWWNNPVGLPAGNYVIPIYYIAQ